MNFKRYLPLFVLPKDDELLSSWITRVAMEHESTTFSFIKYIFDNIDPYLRDIDKSLSEEQFNQLASFVPVSRDRIRKLQLNSFNGKLFDKDSKGQWYPFITNLGPNTGRKAKYIMVYCPSCLAEDAYYRKTWRVSLSVCCTKHGCYLLDACSNCGEGVHFRKINQFKHSPTQFRMDVCYSCEMSLTKGDIILAPDNIFTFQMKWEKLIKEGWDNSEQFSFLYFQGLEYILSALTSKSKRSRDLVKLIIKKLQLNPDVLYWTPSINYNFQLLSNRVILLKSLIYLLDNWPYQFREALSTVGMTRSYFYKEQNHTIPYWLEQQFSFINGKM